MITHTTTPIGELETAARYGEYVRFRGLLQPQRERLMRLVRGRLDAFEAERCVELAVTFAFRRFLNRPDRPLMRWLQSLLREAMNMRVTSDYPDMLDEYSHS